MYEAFVVIVLVFLALPKGRKYEEPTEFDENGQAKGWYGYF